AGDPMKLAPAINDIVRQVDPMVPVAGIASEDDLSDGRIQTERLFAGFYVLFGGLALLLASMGLFGLMSYNVARRTNEIGIRMALGARREDVIAMVMRESMLLVGIGVAIGVTVAIASGRFVAALLFGLAPTDLLTMTAAGLLMVAVSALAGFMPARTESRVEPMIALRYE